MPAAGWPDQGYEPAADQPWQQDTQPDWGAQPQGHAQHGYAQQEFAQQEYAQGYQQQGFPAPAQGIAEAANADSGLPTEFDHLFRDSTPDSRRAIDRQKPAIGAAVPQDPMQQPYQAFQAFPH